jgi:uncharacterized protein YjlB
VTGELRARLEADGLRPSSWGNGPFERYGEHRHDYDKVLVAESGSIVFRLPATGAALELRAGDRLDLPAGTEHAAEVGPDGIRCLEAHLPSGTLASTPRHVPGWGLSEAAARAEVGDPRDPAAAGSEEGSADR